MLRPRSVLVQALSYNIDFARLGSIFLAIGILIYACIEQPFVWTFDKILVLLLMLVCGVVIFLSLFIIGAALSIYTIDGIEIMNVFTEGGRELCQYPVNIYGEFLKNLFIYIIPFATFNYLPMMYLFDFAGSSFWLNGMAPIYGMLFFIPAYLFFKLALKHYASTGC